MGTQIWAGARFLFWLLFLPHFKILKTSKESANNRDGIKCTCLWGWDFVPVCWSPSKVKMKTEMKRRASDLKWQGAKLRLSIWDDKQTRMLSHCFFIFIVDFIFYSAFCRHCTLFIGTFLSDWMHNMIEFVSLNVFFIHFCAVFITSLHWINVSSSGRFYQTITDIILQIQCFAWHLWIH